MDNLGPLILDISSDDEETDYGDLDRGGGQGIGGGGGEFASKEVDWLAELFDDDSDDVVFLSEMFPKSPKKSRPDFAKPIAKVVDDEDDDDCVVLDGDPDTDKQLVVMNNMVDDSDDLEIVGEKGEVACRDFPHARHLCARFLFASTPHNIHCEQCHCYVCDSLAPCSHWGTGVNSVDHCNASDKEEYWKAERKNVKKNDKPVSDICNTNGTGIESFFQSNEAMGSPLSKPDSLPQNEIFIPVTVHPCSRSSNVNLPNAINRARSHTIARVAPRYNPQSLLVSVSHPRSNSHIAPNVAFRHRNHHVGNQNPQSFPPCVGFKRVTGASANSRHPCRFQSSRDPPLNRHPGGSAIQAPITSGRHGSNQQIARNQAAVSFTPQLHLSSPHSMVSGRANYSPFEPRIHSQPSSSYRKPDSVPHQSQMPFQPFVSGNSLSSPPLQPCMYSQPSVGNINTSAAPKSYIPFVPNNPVTPQAIGSCQSDAGNTITNQMHISSRSVVGNDFDSSSSQLQERSNPTSPLICGQNDIQQQLHTQIGVFESPTDFGFFSDSSANHGNMQIHAEQSQYPSTAPAEISQIQNKPEHDQPSIAPVSVDNRPQQSVEPAAAYTSPINDADCLLPESKEPGSFDFHFIDSWMYENQSFSGAMGVYSPEPAFSDPGTLFDL